MFTHHDRKRTTRDQSASILNRPQPVIAAEDVALLSAPTLLESEEMLIVDGRANLGPAQHVENKLSNLLRSSLIPVSHARLTALGGDRRLR